MMRTEIVIKMLVNSLFSDMMQLLGQGSFIGLT